MKLVLHYHGRQPLLKYRIYNLKLNPTTLHIMNKIKQVAGPPLCNRLSSLSRDTLLKVARPLRTLVVQNLRRFIIENNFASK